MRLCDLLNTMDLLTWDQEHSGCRDRQDWGIKNLNKEFYLIACLMLELVGCSFTSKIIWLESLPVIRNTSFVSCHCATQTWKKDQPSEWQWGKKIRYRTMWSSSVVTSKNHVWICGEQVRQWFEDRSYAEILSGSNALAIINCCFIFQAGYYYYSNT